MTFKIYQVCMTEPDSTWGRVTHHLMSPSTACPCSEVAQPFRSNNLSFLLHSFPSFLPSAPPQSGVKMECHPSFPNPSTQFWESLIYCPRGLWRPRHGNLYPSPLLYQDSGNCLNIGINGTPVCNAPTAPLLSSLNVDLILHPKLVFSCFSTHLIHSTC